LRTPIGQLDIRLVNAAPTGKIYPPGPGLLFLVFYGFPSKATRKIVGNGQGPPVEQFAMGA
jgi:hypothetical protein